MKQLLLACFYLLTTGLAAQGPITGFLPGAGNWDFALGYGREHFNDYLFGKEKRNNPLTTYSYNIFLEHGLPGGHSSLVLSVPYVRIDDVNQGLQDGSIFWKYRNEYTERSRSATSVLTAFGLTFPLSAYPLGTDNPIGARATVFQGKIVFQHQHYAGWFVQAQTGFDFRVIPDTQSSIPVLLRAGYGTPFAFVEGWVEYFKTFTNEADQNVAAGNGSDWVRVGGTLYVPVYGGVGVAVNTATILSGRNIGLSQRWGLSVVYQLRRDR